jgi:hypothetical protein
MNLVQLAQYWLACSRVSGEFTLILMDTND